LGGLQMRKGLPRGLGRRRWYETSRPDLIYTGMPLTWCPSCPQATPLQAALQHFSFPQAGGCLGGLWGRGGGGEAGGADRYHTGAPPARQQQETLTCAAPAAPKQLHCQLSVNFHGLCRWWLVGGVADAETVESRVGAAEMVRNKPPRPQVYPMTDLWWPQLPSGPTELEPLHWSIVSPW
jgi:hypothetical protein